MSTTQIDQVSKMFRASTFITHDLSLGNYVSDRIVILRRGAVVEMGDTVKVFGNPGTPTPRAWPPCPSCARSGRPRQTTARRSPRPPWRRPVWSRRRWPNTSQGIS